MKKRYKNTHETFAITINTVSIISKGVTLHNANADKRVRKKIKRTENEK